jgi:Alpha/beta hydrolase domain
LQFSPHNLDPTLLEKTAMKKLSLCKILLTIATSVFVITPAAAKITRFDVTSTAPYGSFKNGDFVRINGTVTGELPHTDPIPGLAQAAKNARGMVEYKAPFVLIVPKDKAAGNGALLIDVPNRGRAITHGLYNSPREPVLPVGSWEAGNRFLQDNGFGVAMLQWELGQGITLPSFVDVSGATRYAEGAGVAAIRDFADFLRSAKQDDSGAANPVAGRFDRTLVFGYSQTARVIKTMLVEGLTQVDGRRVFDGMHINASASGLANIMATGTGPESGTFFTPRFTHPEFRGVTEEPLTYADISARVTARGHGLPKMLVTNMTTDYYSIRASLARTSAQGTADLPIPPHVRIYDVAGGSHSRADKQNCDRPPGRLDFFPIMRATLLNLDAWVKAGTEPPPSRLMPLEPRPTQASLLQTPAHLPTAIVQAPKLDADGNALGGVRLPDMEAPLGTHGAQNLPLSSRPCNLDAAYIAFAPTVATRAAGDTRPALAERYANKEDYVARIRAAARKLVEQRLMNEADAQEVERAAQAVTAW